MSWIQNISSTLKTWVFKKKLLKFSDRYRQDTQACFYCPEMCRFSCPVAETLRHDGTTPRGKMSLLHLAERGFSAEDVAGSAEQREWFLEQCTGCGRCTEYCVYENDVASNLRNERAVYFGERGLMNATSEFSPVLEELRKLKGVVLLCEPDRKEWWESRRSLLTEMGVQMVSAAPLPHRDWSWGKVSDVQLESIGAALSGCSQIWVESPEAGWLLAKGVKEDREALQAEVRVVWQRFFGKMAGLELGPDEIFHESWHLSRLFPRLGYSVPMYERGLMPFHHGWNVWDCGGEGYYRIAHAEHAREMGKRYLEDIEKDGRQIKKIVCQCLSCVEHLAELTEVPVVYWLDEMTRDERS